MSFEVMEWMMDEIDHVFMGQISNGGSEDSWENLKEQLNICIKR